MWQWGGKAGGAMIQVGREGRRGWEGRWAARQMRRGGRRAKGRRLKGGIPNKAFFL
jgi:hypothetical protein